MRYSEWTLENHCYVSSEDNTCTKGYVQIQEWPKKAYIPYPMFALKFCAKGEMMNSTG